MAYDFDIAQERFAIEGGRRARVANVAVQARDLETIITILELAAISLTFEPDATFTRKQLVEEAHKIGGPDIDLQDEDIDIVLQKQGFLKKVGTELRLR